MREKVLFISKDNKVVVADIEYSTPSQKTQKVTECKDYIEAHTYNEFINDARAAQHAGPTAPKYEFFDRFDYKNSAFLFNEIKGYDYRKERHKYQNKIHSNDCPDGMEHYLPGINYALPDSDVPEDVKNLGFTLKPCDREFKVIYNRLSRQYSVENFSGVRAQVDSGGRQITLFRNHFKFPPEAKSRLHQMIAEFLRRKAANPNYLSSEYSATLSKKDKSLFEIYGLEYENVSWLKWFMHHEFKHIRNHMFEDVLLLERGDKRLSVEDTYKLKVENERSAYLSQVINSVNKYLIKGNLDDFSAFDGESNWLEQKLSKLPVGQRMAYVLNTENLVAGSLAHFAQDHQDFYDKNQFKKNVEDDIDKAPLSVPEDTTHELYEKVRRQFYTFSLYNPRTGGYNVVNLVDKIKPEQLVKISPYAQINIITPEKLHLKRRLNEYQEKLNRGEIDPSLVEPARQLLKQRMRSAEFIDPHRTNIDCMPNDAPNERPLYPDAPNDHAEWSDELQRYYKQFDTYHEIAKNNNEYSFKINDDTVRYTSKTSLTVSDNSQYDTYLKIVKEPSNIDTVVNFKEHLSEDQALKLYIACVVTGRQTAGKVPTDFSKLSKLQVVPASHLRKFEDIMASRRTTPSAVRSAETAQGTNSLRQRIIFSAKQRKL